MFSQNEIQRDIRRTWSEFLKARGLLSWGLAGKEVGVEVADTVWEKKFINKVVKRVDF